MHIDDLNEFKDLFTVIVEPDHSLEILKQFEEKYPTFDSRTVQEYCIVLGLENILKEVIPDVDEWVYHIEKVIQYGGELDVRTLVLDEEGDFSSNNNECIVDIQKNKDEGNFPSSLFFCMVPLSRYGEVFRLTYYFFYF